MAVSRPLRRLLQILEAQEEECRAAMEQARTELRRLEQAFRRCVERERGGRQLVAASAVTGETMDRIAGLEEQRAGKFIAAALAVRLRAAQQTIEARRSEFLGKRVERRQTETLIEEAEVKEAVEAGRRAQRDLDDWFLARRKTDE
jgi:predicted GIY-YIG superfamily endonuclease